MSLSLVQRNRKPVFQQIFVLKWKATNLLKQNIDAVDSVAVQYSHETIPVFWRDILRLRKDLQRQKQMVCETIEWCDR